MNNLMIHIYCLLTDLDDVQVQINYIVNQILFALPHNQLSLTYSVNYHKDGLVITFNNVDDLMESCEVIINNLENYGWLDSVSKIELNDYLSAQKTYLIPRSSSKDYKNLIPDNEVPNINHPILNSVNFN